MLPSAVQSKLYSVSQIACFTTNKFVYLATNKFVYLATNKFVPSFLAMAEPEGNDFLQVNEHPELSDDDKAIMENGFKSLCGAAPKTAEEKRIRYVQQVYFCMDAIARWSGNKIENVAMCVDSAFVKNFKYSEHDYKARPYVFHGVNFQTIFLNFCQQGYVRHMQKDKMACEVAGGENYLPPADWDTVKNLATVGMRFHLQHWDAHPHLTRKQAFGKGKELLHKESATRKKPKQVMTAYLETIRVEDATTSLLGLEMEMSSGMTSVFTKACNEGSNDIISEYLKATDH